MQQIKMLIIEDEPMIARDLATTLEGMDYAIAEICYTYEEGLTFLKTKQADFVILDINLGKGQEGISLGAFIDQQLKLPFIYLTSYSDKETIAKVKRTYPMAYLLKPFEEKELFTAIEIALSNHSRIYNPVQFDIHSINHKLLSPLTPKEFDILLDVYAGLTNQQLCEKHFISMNTVKTHVKHLFNKFDVSDRTAFIVKLRNWI